MTTVSNLAKNIQTKIQTLTTLESDIRRNLQTTGTSSHNFHADNEISKMHEKAKGADRQFEEEEAAIQAMGGKSRMQTLQEFVLLFFFVSFGIFTLSLVLNAYVRGDQTGAAKIAGAMAIILLIVCCILLKLA